LAFINTFLLYQKKYLFLRDCFGLKTPCLENTVHRYSRLKKLAYSVKKVGRSWFKTKFCLA